MLAWTIFCCYVALCVLAPCGPLGVILLTMVLTPIWLPLVILIAYVTAPIWAHK